MPQIKFTDRNLQRVSADKTSWFTDPSVKGLRLCVTAGGVKTWYANKWDPTAQKTRQVKLAQWAAKGAHCAWAKKQVGRVAFDIQEGKILTRDEREAERAALAMPTFREALEQYITHRTTARASGKGHHADRAIATALAYLSATHLDTNHGGSYRLNGWA